MNDDDKAKFLNGVFRRPKMHSSDIESVRDLLMFVQGVCCGLRPPHGAHELAAFREFLRQNLTTCIPGVSGTEDFARFEQAKIVGFCDEIAEAYRAWRARVRSRVDDAGA
jgi:hypothetical protein